MISCNQYDYIEIVCLFRYPIELKLKNGNTILGIALDTARNAQQQECIKLGNLNSHHKEITATQLIHLDDIASLRVCIDNPHFQSIDFN